MTRKRDRIIWKLVRERYKGEIVIRLALLLSIAYATISCFMLRCNPININPVILDIMATFDEVIRNCCYSVIAGTVFYFLNDFYKNIYSLVDTYNSMYPELYKLWLKVYQLILSLSDYKYDISHKDDVYNLLLTSFIKEDDIHKAVFRKVEIPYDKCHLLLCLWTDVNTDRRKFLETHGNIISREEYSKLNYNEYDASVDILKESMPEIEHYEKDMTVSISNHYIRKTIFLICTIKNDLVTMANKYSKFYYENQKGIITDVF